MPEKGTYPYDQLFQRYLLSLAVQDPAFLLTHRECVAPNYFDDPVTRFLAQAITSFFDQYKQIPQMAALSQYVLASVQSKHQEGIAQPIMELVGFLYSGPVPNPEFIRDSAVKFAKMQGLKKAVLHGFDVLKANGDPEEVLSMLSRTLEIGVANNPGTDFWDVLGRLPEIWQSLQSSRGNIPCRFMPSLDDALFGGPRRGELYCVQGIPKVGKCISADSLVWSPDGGYYKAAEFHSATSIGECPNGTRVACVLSKVKTGRKMVYDVHLRSGRVLRGLSANHGVRTAEGYVPVRRLSVGMGVAAPLSLQLNAVRPWGDIELGYALGVFLGDGCLTTPQPVLSSKSNDIPDAVLDSLPASWGMQYTRSHGAVIFTSQTKYRFNPLTFWFRSLGLSGLNSHTKCVPGDCWLGGSEVIRHVLAGLWDTDGYIPRSRGAAQYCTVSRKLAHDVLTMLHVVGIYATIRRKGTAYLVEFTGLSNYHVFQQLVPIHHIGKVARLQRICKSTSVRQSRCVSWFQRMPAGAGCSRSGRPGGRRCPSAVDTSWSDTHQFHLGVHWDSVESVTVQGVRETYDLEMDSRSKSFTVDGLLVHNSHFLVNFGAEAIMQGLRVLHITIGDLKEFDVALRYAARLCNMPTNLIMWGNPAFFDRVRQIIFARRQLLIRYFSPYALTCSQIRAYMGWLQASEGFTPDMLIVDYPDKMFYDRKYTYNELGRIYMELKGILDDFNCVGWVASQSNRFAVDQATNRAAYAAESWDKVANADGWIPLSQTDADRAKHRIKAYIEMLRFGADHREVFCQIDYERSMIKEISQEAMNKEAETERIAQANMAQAKS